MLKFGMFFKLTISLILLILSLVASFTMFEIFGQNERRISMNLFKTLHRINGRIFFIVFIVGSVICIYLLSKSKTELTPRATLHAFSAVAVFLLLCLKILFIKFYRQFYSYAKLLGILIVLLTFNLIAFSTGYSIVVGDKLDINKVEINNNSKLSSEMYVMVKEGSVERGKKLFSQNCSSCHYTDRKDFRRAAPGLKGILSEKNLPVSKKPATPENIANQIRKPFKFMPAFTDLKDEEVNDIIEYLKTL